MRVELFGKYLSKNLIISDLCKIHRKIRNSTCNLYQNVV